MDPVLGGIGQPGGKRPAELTSRMNTSLGKRPQADGPPGTPEDMGTETGAVPVPPHCGARHLTPLRGPEQRDPLGSQPTPASLPVTSGAHTPSTPNCSDD